MFLLRILVFVAAADGVERLLERFGVVTRAFYIVTVLGLVGGAPRVADSSVGGACRFFNNSIPPSKQNRLGKNPTVCNKIASGGVAR